MSKNDDDLVSVNGAARMLGVSATTVRNWSQDGKLAERRTVGGHRRYLVGDIKRLIDELSPPEQHKILIIDDDSDIRFILREAFSSVGFHVTEAPSGLLGLDSMDDNPPSVVLLDIMMPGIDGFQVMKYLEQFSVKVPVIAMSALGERVESRARELGADEFVAKPFDIREMVKLTRSLAEQYKAS